MKNFVFISPHFPDSYYHFIEALKRNGFRVLGIGDALYDELSQPLKNALTEYYCCYNMENFDNEVRALTYFQDKYGHIDFLESNNEFCMCNLVDGRKAVIESADNRFEPYTVHYAETFIIPAKAGNVIIRPADDGPIKVIKANVRF